MARRQLVLSTPLQGVSGGFDPLRANTAESVPSPGITKAGWLPAHKLEGPQGAWLVQFHPAVFRPTSLLGYGRVSCTAHNELRKVVGVPDRRVQEQGSAHLLPKL